MLRDTMILQVTSYKQDLQNGQLTMLMVMSILCGKVSGKESLHAMNMVCSITSQSGRMSLPCSKGKKFKVSKKQWNTFHQQLAYLLLSLKMHELKLNQASLDYNTDFFWDSSFIFRDHTQPNWFDFITQY